MKKTLAKTIFALPLLVGLAFATISGSAAGSERLATLRRYMQTKTAGLRAAFQL